MSMRARVTTPETPQRPTGYMWDQLDAATSLEQLAALDKHAAKHGYTKDGQIRAASAEKKKELAAPKEG